MCVTNGLLLLQEFEEVSTVTVRAYCLCPAPNPEKPQPGYDEYCDNQKKVKINFFKSKGLASPPAAIIVPIGPNTKWPGQR